MGIRRARSGAARKEGATDHGGPRRLPGFSSIVRVGTTPTVLALLGLKPAAQKFSQGEEAAGGPGAHPPVAVRNLQMQFALIVAHIPESPEARRMRASWREGTAYRMFVLVY